MSKLMELIYRSLFEHTYMHAYIHTHTHTQYVNHKPYEIVARRRSGRCRDDWYAKRSQVACGFQEENGNKIFDSQVGIYCIHRV